MVRRSGDDDNRRARRRRARQRAVRDFSPRSSTRSSQGVPRTRLASASSAVTSGVAPCAASATYRQSQAGRFNRRAIRSADSCSRGRRRQSLEPCRQCLDECFGLLERNLPVAHPPPGDVGALRNDQIQSEENLVSSGQCQCLVGQRLTEEPLAGPDSLPGAGAPIAGGGAAQKLMVRWTDPDRREACSANSSRSPP